jgi:ribosomal protein L37E
MIQRAHFHRQNSGYPIATAQPQGRLRCKRCGSLDLWRIATQSGIVSAIMGLFGRKPLECRSCGRICYPPAKTPERNVAAP